MELQVGRTWSSAGCTSPRGVDALKSVQTRTSMVPLTDATIAYNIAGDVVARDVRDDHRQPLAGGLDRPDRR